ncbi:MAG: hypothetical protein OEU09_14725 [Rhodospirillales bacterium]|nr:hypothetical protein [Rhodospirillales bacterium]MDH3912543.1 hypothetical protein [Rhodospirillales bacterium]MDH3918576.1 hypothetical protein [Rhodospirillales bacterium]MDH3966636.1 hypothetical protein [Rhodospirillales bacterium]
MNRRSFFCLGFLSAIATVSFLAEALANPEGNDSAVMDIEERAVIDAFLHELGADSVADVRIFVARRTMEVSSGKADYLRQELPDLQDEAFRDCVVRSRHPVRLMAALPDGRDMDYIDWDKRDRLFRNLDPTARTLASSVAIRFSRVGFSPDRTQAVFQLEQDCGMLCGTGVFIFMKREGIAWAVAGSVQIWIS